jgi:hypothetical protein
VVSMDQRTIYHNTTRRAVPCRGHLLRSFPCHPTLANRPLDLVLSTSHHGVDGTLTSAHWWATRRCRPAGPECLDARQRQLLAAFCRTASGEREQSCQESRPISR